MDTIVDHIRKQTLKRYLIGIDLECTCWPAEMIGAPDRMEREVIEIGLAAIDMEKLEIVGTHSVLIKPEHHPVLSEFCTSLTTITNEMLECAPLFSEGLDQAMGWLSKFNEDYAWCSWGMFDLHHLQHESHRKGVDLGLRSALHFNAKTLYSQSHPRLKRRGMKSALDHEGVKLAGTYHRGVDDATNMARLIIHEHGIRHTSQGAKS